MRGVPVKGDGGAIPVRLSVVRTSVVLLQSRICAFTRARISARRAVTDQHREPIQDVNLVTRVGLEWKRRSAAPKGADACSGLGEPNHCTRNGNDVLIDPPLFCWPGRLFDGARLASARDFAREYDISRSTWQLDNQAYHLPRGRPKNRTFAVVLLNFLHKPLTFVQSMVLRL